MDIVVNKDSPLLDHRYYGESLPFSYGTARFFEVWIASKKEIDKKFEYPIIYISLETLFRNYIQSFNQLDPMTIKEDDLLGYFYMDLQQLQAALEYIEVPSIIYTTHEFDIFSREKQYPYAKHTAYNPKVKRYHALYNRILKRILHDKFINIIEVKDKLSPAIHAKDKTYDPKLQYIIFTRRFTDILDYQKFNHIYLGESYTGHIRNRYSWTPRLTDDKNAIRIPFNRLTLQVFGDNRYYLSPIKKTYRMDVIKYANTYNWTPRTPYGLIMRQISSPSVYRTATGSYLYLLVYNRSP